VLAPVAALFALRWLWQNIDSLIRRFFPGQEWQRQLGWLNIRAERRASALLRWISYAAHTVLLFALAGIVWSAAGLGQLTEWRDPEALLRIENRLSILLVCGAVWAIYLGGDLLPRLRRDYEEEELEHFRAQGESPPEETVPRARGNNIREMDIIVSARGSPPPR
jgi:hypothetical protein